MLKKLLCLEDGWSWLIQGLVVSYFAIHRISDRSQRIEQHRGFPVTGVDTPSVTPSQVRISPSAKEYHYILSSVPWSIIHDWFNIRYFCPALPAVCHLEDISAFVNKYGDDKGPHRSTRSNEVAAFKNTLRRANTFLALPMVAHLLLLVRSWLQHRQVQQGVGGLAAYQPHIIQYTSFPLQSSSLAPMS